MNLKKINLDDVIIHNRHLKVLIKKKLNVCYKLLTHNYNFTSY